MSLWWFSDCEEDKNNNNKHTLNSNAPQQSLHIYISKVIEDVSSGLCVSRVFKLFKIKGWTTLGSRLCVIIAAKALLLLTNGATVCAGSRINSNNTG